MKGPGWRKGPWKGPGYCTRVSHVRLVGDLSTCRRLSKSVDHLNETNKAGIVHCWEKTNLLKVWEHEVQIEAMHKARDIFPNLNGSDAEDYVEGSTEDPEAFWEGEGFMEGGEEDEWEDWVGNQTL